MKVKENIEKRMADGAQRIIDSRASRLAQSVSKLLGTSNNLYDFDDYKSVGERLWDSYEHLPPGQTRLRLGRHVRKYVRIHIARSHESRPQQMRTKLLSTCWQVAQSWVSREDILVYWRVSNVFRKLVRGSTTDDAEDVAVASQVSFRERLVEDRRYTIRWVHSDLERTDRLGRTRDTDLYFNQYSDLLTCNL